VVTVSSGGHIVASINLVGHYTTADFHPGNDGSGDLEITDPPVIEQKAGSAPATITACDDGDVGGRLRGLAQISAMDRSERSLMGC
jgi:hypothetical protein